MERTFVRTRIRKAERSNRPLPSQREMLLVLRQTIASRASSDAELQRTFRLLKTRA
jgi:hypothetical protein